MSTPRGASVGPNATRRPPEGHNRTIPATWIRAVACSCAGHLFPQLRQPSARQIDPSQVRLDVKQCMVADQDLHHISTAFCRRQFSKSSHVLCSLHVQQAIRIIPRKQCDHGFRDQITPQQWLRLAPTAEHLHISISAMSHQEFPVQARGAPILRGSNTATICHRLHLCPVRKWSQLCAGRKCALADW